MRKMTSEKRTQEEMHENENGGEKINQNEMDQESQSNDYNASDEKKEKSSKSKHRKDDKTEKLEAEIIQLNDKYLRLYSEFDNYRKRTIKEKIELSKRASTDIILTILPVLDDFERAINAFEISTESTDALKHGIILIFGKFINILSQQGLQQMKTIGEEFNTDFHEAITNIPASNPEQKGKVVDEIEKGYMLNGKVIRYAKVGVAN
jgi:molecular chaperone GrpE